MAASNSKRAGDVRHNTFKLDRVPPPAPEPKRHTLPPPLPVEYDFDAIPVGGSGVIDRAYFTVRDAMYRFQKTPRGQGMKFKVRPITKRLTRVWRIA